MHSKLFIIVCSLYPYRVCDTVQSHLRNEIRSLNMSFSSLQQFSKPRKIIIMIIIRNFNGVFKSCRPQLILGFQLPWLKSWKVHLIVWFSKAFDRFNALFLPMGISSGAAGFWTSSQRIFTIWEFGWATVLWWVLAVKYELCQ